MLMFVFLLLLVGFVFYFPIFTAYFFMDDFYFLTVFQASGIKEFFHFFAPVTGIPYRPISQQVFFFSLQKIFGLNPLPFHLVVFLLHAVNSFLLYQLSLNFVKDKLKARLIALMYLTASLHFVGLYSITGSYVVFGIFFFLLSFVYWFKFEKEKKTTAYLCSLLLFTLGVFSSEIVAVLPLLIFLFSQLKKKIKLLLPFFVPIAVNLFINNYWAGAPKTKAFSFEIKAFPSLIRWYFLRALGLPEGVKNGEQWLKFLLYASFLGILLVFFFGLLKYGKTLFQSKQSQRSKEIRLLLKYFIWIIAGALPFYFMPHHLNPIYFSLSFMAFLLLLSGVLTKKLFLVYGLLFLTVSFLGIRLLLNTHWTVRRSQLSKQLIDQAKIDFKDNRAGLVFSSQQDLEEARITLLEDKALKLFLGKDTEVIYKVE